ncbi:MAG: ATP synthase subunit C [Spirochaetales bacterium]|jgi:V/A-type H+-transporting ATPase subunit K|nr:ATP synthase subunit C [Spirochaetales bacterium]
MKKKILIVAALLLVVGGAAAFAVDEQASGEAASNTHWRWIAAAAAVGMSCIAGGIAVGQIGASAMGAMSENPELSGKALPFIGLAEGICLWGFLVALLILFV